MGSVSPLVAIYQELKIRDRNLEALWLGTKNGPEKEFIANYQIPYIAIKGDKIRRYLSFWNIITPIKVIWGFFQAKRVLKKFKPAAVLTAGSFVAVPVTYAAKQLKIPVFVHQQDLEIGLANKMMAPKATAITVTFSDTLGSFDIKKTFHIGNPVRREVFSGSKEKAAQIFKLNPNFKTILIMGGGTGAQVINQIILEIIGQLSENYQIIHLCGKGKTISQQLPDYYDRETLKRIEARYREYEFLNNEIFEAMALADLIVSRSGFSALSEFAVLGKAVLLIPIPGHQEINAQYFAKYNAVKILKQEKLNKEAFLQALEYLLQNPGELQTLSRNISQLIDKDAAKRYVELVYQILGSEN